LGRYKCKICGEYTGKNDGHSRYCTKCYLKILENNFYTIEGKFCYLTNEFNNISNISVNKYVKYLKYNTESCNNWKDVMIYYGKYDEYFNQICNKYTDWSIKNNSISIDKFSKECKISYRAMCDISVDKIKSKCNLKYYKRNNHKDFEIDFNDVKNRFGYILLYTDFFENCRISRGAYENRFKNKDLPMYDYIVRLFSSDKEFENYIDRKRIKKKSILIDNGILPENKYTKKELKSNLVSIFDEFYKEYNAYPSRRNFNKLSSICDKVYRKYYNKPWLDILNEEFGYKIDNSFKSEIQCLNSISNILDCEYQPQKTWDWLIGNGGKNMFCDGYFKEFNLIVEFQGLQHREPVEYFGGLKTFNRQIANDKLKSKLLDTYNINLIEIWFDEDWQNKDYIKSKLENFINCCKY